MNNMMNKKKNKIKYPLGVLAVCSMILGYMFYDHFSTIAEDNDKAWDDTSSLHPMDKGFKKNDYRSNEWTQNFNKGKSLKTRGENRPAVSNQSHQLSEFKGRDLQLIGTMITDQGSFAVIKDGIHAKQRLYKTGEMIRGAVVHKIFQERVTLKLGNKVITLHLMNSVSVGYPTDTHFDHLNQNRKKVPYSPKQLYDMYPVAGDMEEIDRLKKQIDLSANIKAGKESGVSIKHLPINSIFQQMNLLEDDVILGINGKEIETLDDAQEIFETIKNSAQGYFKIQRDGKIQKISYQLGSD